MQFVEKPSRRSFVDLEGKSVGLLTVIGWAGIVNRKNMWWVQCSCEDKTVFKTHSISLQKSLVLSCGCLRKRNTNDLTPQEQAQALIDKRYTLTHYQGMQHPCNVECTVCGDHVEVKSFYSLRQRVLVCSCVGNKIKEKYEEILEPLHYNLIEICQGYVHVKCRHCGAEKSGVRISSISEPCPCVESGSEGDKPVCVYVLKDAANSGYYKIGISSIPKQRLATLNKQDFHQWEEVTRYWVKDRAVAYRVESYLHSDARLSHPYEHGVFDGATEVVYYSGTITDILSNYKDTLDLVKAALSSFLPDIERLYPHSIEYQGMWYPYPSKLAEDYGITWDTVKSKLKKGMPLSEALVNNASTPNMYEWKGITLTYRQWYYRLLLCEALPKDFTIKLFKERITKIRDVGKTIYLGKRRIRRYKLDDNEIMTLKSLCAKLGISKIKVVKLLGKGLDLQTILNMERIKNKVEPVFD